MKRTARSAKGQGASDASGSASPVSGMEPMGEGLIGAIKQPRRKWQTMTEGGLVTHAREYLTDNQITKRKRLEDINPSLYDILRKRHLLDRVFDGIEVEKRVEQNWQTITEDELVAYARKYLTDNQITKRKRLADANSGLYHILHRKQLLDSVFDGIEAEKRNKWQTMTEGELVTHIREYLTDNQITKRKRLEDINPSLYGILQRKQLLDRVFSNIEEAQRLQGMDAVCTALEEFGGVE